VCAIAQQNHKKPDENKRIPDGLEKGNAAENFGERGPQEDLGHAAGLDQNIVGGDGHNLSWTRLET
jgi:hypothetical protein